MIKKPLTSKRSIAVLIPTMLFAMILLVGASVQAPVKAESSAYSPSKVLAATYSWKQDHCESCDYLAQQIKFFMNEAVYPSYQSAERNVAANIATNYLKLYELNECHKYHRDTSLGIVNMALELRDLASGRRTGGKTLQ